MILEIKHVRKKESMEDVLREAANQIIQKKYGSRMRYEGCTILLQYGIAFWNNSSMIKTVND